MSSPHDHDPSAINSPKQVRRSFLLFPLSRPTTSLTRCDFEHASLLVFETWAYRVERWSGVKKSPSCCCLELHTRPRNLKIQQKQQHTRGSWTRSQAPTIHVSSPGCETPISKAEHYQRISTYPVTILDNQCPSHHALITIDTLSARHVYTTCLNERQQNCENEVFNPQPDFPSCGYSIFLL